MVANFKNYWDKRYVYHILPPFSAGAGFRNHPPPVRLKSRGEFWGIGTHGDMKRIANNNEQYRISHLGN